MYLLQYVVNGFDMKYIKIKKYPASSDPSYKDLQDKVVLVRDNGDIVLHHATFHVDDFVYENIPTEQIDKHLVYVGKQTENGFAYSVYQ